MKKLIAFSFLAFILFYAKITPQSNSDNYGNSLTNNTHDEPLPVTLIYFEGYAFSDRILIRWGTATEINNYGFDIQRSKLQPLVWETIGFEFGHGNSNSPKHYTFWDTTVVDTSIYVYRLKQINTDGSFEYSDTIHVNFHVTSVEYQFSEILPGSFHLGQNFPNPFNPSTQIFISVVKPSNVSVKVYDILGKEIATLLNDFLSAGLYLLKFNAPSDLSSGVYIYQMSADGFIQTRKMILKK